MKRLLNLFVSIVMNTVLWALFLLYLLFNLVIDPFRSDSPLNRYLKLPVLLRIARLIALLCIIYGGFTMLAGMVGTAVFALRFGYVPSDEFTRAFLLPFTIWLVGRLVDRQLKKWLKSEDGKQTS